MPARFRGGFTLIELLVVVAIIALLIAILLPSLADARRLSQRTVCGTNLSAIGRGAAIYAEEFGQLPYCQSRVYSSGWASNQLVYFRRDLTGTWPGFPIQLAPYVGGARSKMLVCPATTPTMNPSVWMSDSQIATPNTGPVTSMSGNYMLYLSDIGNSTFTNPPQVRYYTDAAKTQPYDGLTQRAKPNVPGARPIDVTPNQQLVQDLLWEIAAGSNRVTQGNHMRNVGNLVGELRTGATLASGYFVSERLADFSGFNVLMADYSVAWVKPGDANVIYTRDNVTLYTNGPRQ